MSDRIVGDWIKTNRGIRDQIVISAKITAYSDDVPWTRGGQPVRSTLQQVTAAVDAMLQRLQTDHIDLLQFQWPERYTPMHGSIKYDYAKVSKPPVAFFLENVTSFWKPHVLDFRKKVMFP